MLGARGKLELLGWVISTSGLGEITGDRCGFFRANLDVELLLECKQVSLPEFRVLFGAVRA